MANRFTDTDKWKKSFLRGLPSNVKLLWLYICDDCDHAGIWPVDFDVAEIRTGETVTEQEATELLKEKIVVFDGGKKWFIPSFVDYQYPKGLFPSNRVHNSILKILAKYHLLEFLAKEKEGALEVDKGPLEVSEGPLGTPKGCKDKDYDKDYDKDKDFGKSENLFEPAGLVPEMVAEFTKENTDYPPDQTEDFPAVREMAVKILKSEKDTGQITGSKNREIILRRWGDLVRFARADPHYSNYSLSRLNKHFQSFFLASKSKISNAKYAGTGNRKDAGTNEVADRLAAKLAARGNTDFRT